MRPPSFLDQNFARNNGGKYTYHSEGKTLIDREIVTRAFDQYTALYNANDPKIKLKIDHTYRVAALCAKIARSTGIRNVDMAWLSGMLHDIGRFEQVKRYNTFVDADSVDHAQLGADMLFHDGLLEQFKVGLSKTEKHILELCIRSHSAYRLSVGLNETETSYCNVLRDADKIDIFRVNCDTPPEEIYNVSSEELKTSAVSEEVKDCFRNHTAVMRKLKKTAIDYIVGHVCLAFELVYPVSREIAREQGYVDRLLSFESDNPDTKNWFEYMKNNIWSPVEQETDSCQ